GQPAKSLSFLLLPPKARDIPSPGILWEPACFTMSQAGDARPFSWVWWRPVSPASHDPRGLVAPITVAQQALVELAGRQPWQLGLEIDRTRHLLARQRLIAEGDQLGRQL